MLKAISQGATTCGVFELVSNAICLPNLWLTNSDIYDTPTGQENKVYYFNTLDLRKVLTSLFIRSLMEAMITERANRLRGLLQKKCPKCGSTNILINSNSSLRASKKLAAGIVFLPLAFFVGRKKVQVSECFDCGARWKAK